MCPLCRNEKYCLILGLFIYQIYKWSDFLKARVLAVHPTDTDKSKNVTRLPDWWDIQKETSSKEEKEQWPRNKTIIVKRAEWGSRRQRTTSTTSTEKGAVTLLGSATRFINEVHSFDSWVLNYFYMFHCMIHQIRNNVTIFLLL